MKTKLDELIDEYENAINNNDEKRIEEVRYFFKQIGIEPFGLDIIAFTQWNVRGRKMNVFIEQNKKSKDIYREWMRTLSKPEEEFLEDKYRIYLEDYLDKDDAIQNKVMRKCNKLLKDNEDDIMFTYAYNHPGVTSLIYFSTVGGSLKKNSNKYYESDYNGCHHNYDEWN